MKNSNPKPDPATASGYYGQILNAHYSAELKTYVTECIRRFHEFDMLGTPSIPYIAGWREETNIIWYEFAGKALLALLQCEGRQAAAAFRDSVVEHRVYKYQDAASGLREEILQGSELLEHRVDLREKVKGAGAVEAVYKSSLPDGGAVWFKDQATVVSFARDRICISLGSLTAITKEMETEEHLRHTREALRESEEKYRQLSIRDNLTGLYNTRHLYQALTELIRQCVAGGRCFSLLFMDIDDFKQVVDTHGHLHASRALQEVAATIRSVLREPAYGVAYGGDEFVIVLPQIAKVDALSIAEQLRHTIRQTAFLRKVGLAVHLKASFGVSTFPDDAATLTDVLALADKAMFRVKKRGKDSVGEIGVG
jgi:diguanylate cyclase (GGDEF)-like protein